jgi:hypothetical protein
MGRVGLLIARNTLWGDFACLLHMITSHYIYKGFEGVIFNTIEVIKF